MSDKKQREKNDSVDMDIKTGTSERPSYNVTLYEASSIQKTFSPVDYKFKPGFTYQSQASWKTEVWKPRYSQRTEQQFTDTQDILCSIPAFREEIIQLRNLLSARNIYLDYAVREACTAWHIPEREQWILWLLENWDPATAPYPLHFSPTRSASLPPWTITLSSLVNQNTGAEICRSATITLNAGVSGREAQRIATLAQKKLDNSKMKKGRPRASDKELDALRAEFAKLGVPKPGKRSAMILKVQKAYSRPGKPPLSITVIGNEYRRWLEEQGQPVRRYTT